MKLHFSLFFSPPLADGMGIMMGLIVSDAERDNCHVYALGCKSVVICLILMDVEDPHFSCSRSAPIITVLNRNKRSLLHTYIHCGIKSP